MQQRATLEKTIDQIRGTAFAVWLFTYSDLKTIIVPSLAFAITVAVSSHTSTSTDLQLFVGSLRALLWLWLNLLPFNIDNQSGPGSIAEDMENKPWRALPSKKISPACARCVMVASYLVALCISYHLGGLRQWSMLIILGIWYNHAGGSDRLVERNVINSFGFISFLSGAAEVLLQDDKVFEGQWLGWLAAVGSIVLTTVPLQDMSDQAGDRTRQRSTLPLTLGDRTARLWLASAVLCWSIACPLHWPSPLYPSIACWGLGLLVSGRCWFLGSVAADKLTFKLWNAWMVSVYILSI